jgi:hypothetical protein
MIDLMEIHRCLNLRDYMEEKYRDKVEEENENDV